MVRKNRIDFLDTEEQNKLAEKARRFLPPFLCKDQYGILRNDGQNKKGDLTPGGRGKWKGRKICPIDRKKYTVAAA